MIFVKLKEPKVIVSVESEEEQAILLMLLKKEGIKNRFGEFFKETDLLEKPTAENPIGYDLEIGLVNTKDKWVKMGYAVEPLIIEASVREPDNQEKYGDYLTNLNKERQSLIDTLEKEILRLDSPKANKADRDRIREYRHSIEELKKLIAKNII